jgi:hypothetical protein
LVLRGGFVVVTVPDCDSEAFGNALWKEFGKTYGRISVEIT